MATTTKTSTEYRQGKYVDLVTGQICQGQIPVPETETVTIPENTTQPGVQKPEKEGL